MQLLLQSVSCFQDCKIAPDKDMNVEPRYLRSPCTVPHPYKLIYHYWNEECTPNYLFPNCLYEHICSLCTFNPEAINIHHKVIYCPSQPKAEAGHLLQDSHGLHHYSLRQSQPTPLLPKTTSPNHHF